MAGRWPRRWNVWLIYAARPEHAALRSLIANRSPVVSAISYVEVLGYHRLAEPARRYFEAFFEAACILPLSDPVLRKAVELRQTRKMTLGDALVAASALVHDLTVVTRNTEDFEWIQDLRLLNPFAEQL